MYVVANPSPGLEDEVFLVVGELVGEEFDRLRVYKSGDIDMLMSEEIDNSCGSNSEDDDFGASVHEDKYKGKRIRRSSCFLLTSSCCSF